MSAMVVLRRPRVCDRHHTRRSLAGQVWDAVRHGHTSHVCTRSRPFQHGHRGRCVCGRIMPAAKDAVRRFEPLNRRTP